MKLTGSKTERNLLASFAGELDIAASFPAGVIGATKDNLKSSADGEKMEWGKIYPEAEKIAQSEGFTEILSGLRPSTGVL